MYRYFNQSSRAQLINSCESQISPVCVFVCIENANPKASTVINKNKLTKN